jgi:DNA polymerase-1
MRVVHGIIVNRLVADTMLMSYSLDPTRGKYGYGLKPLSQEHTDLGAYETEVKELEDDVDEDGVVIKTKWEKIDMLTLATYNICDCDATLQIYKKFAKQLAEYNMNGVTELMAEAIHVICDLQINGVLIDQEFVKDTIPKLESLLEGYDAQLTELAGGRYDWNSPKELGKLLYELLEYKNPYGANSDTYPTDDEALDRINTPFTAVMRKYRKTSKLCNTYFKGYFSKVEHDGRLRANYWLNSTETGRLSSDEPNLQNLPRTMSEDDVGYYDLVEYKVKNAIIAPMGWTLVQADQSQLEMRVAGIVSNDPELVYSYSNGIDMHSLNAKVCFSIVTDLKAIVDQVESMGLVKDSEQGKLQILKRELNIIKGEHGDKRTAAKSVSFGVLYGKFCHIQTYSKRYQLTKATTHVARIS